MAESAFLLRSFSQPAEISSHGTDEGHPIRALSESISFGRFMSESLSWEKWSSFSHNRYLEEVEKFSKPGTVAEKKAFFEAYYGKRAKAKTQEMLDKANAAAAVSEVESTSETDKDLSVGEEIQRDRSHTELDYAQDEAPCSPTSKTDETTIAEEHQEVAQQNVNVENSELLETAENHLEMASPEEKIANKRNSSLSSKGRQVIPSSSGSRSCSGGPRPVSSCGRGNDVTSNSSKKSLTASKDKKSSTPVSLNRSLVFASCTHEASENSLRVPKKRLASPRATSIEYRGKNKAASPCDKKPEVKSNKKKRLVPSSVHTTASLVSSVGQTRKLSQKMRMSSTTSRQLTSPQAENSVLAKGKASIESSKSQRRVLPNSLHVSINLTSRGGQTSKTSLRMLKDDPRSTKCSTTASVAGSSELPSKNLLSEDKRKNTLAGRPVSSGIPSRKIQSSVELCGSSGKLPTPSGSKIRSSTVPSPFRFQSDERAERRKEFFKKLEEKNKEKEVVEEQLLPRSKMPLTLLKSNHERSSKFPISSSPVNTGSPRRMRERCKQSKIHPSISLPKTKAHENSSPNIQL